MRLTMERETGWAAWKGAGCRDFQRPTATKPELRPGQASRSASPSGAPAAASARPGPAPGAAAKAAGAGGTGQVKRPAPRPVQGGAKRQRPAAREPPRRCAAMLCPVCWPYGGEGGCGAVRDVRLAATAAWCPADEAARLRRSFWRRWGLKAAVLHHHHLDTCSHQHLQTFLKPQEGSGIAQTTSGQQRMPAVLARQWCISPAMCADHIQHAGCRPMPGLAPGEGALAGLQSLMQGGVPSLRQLLQPIVDDMDPENGIEEEYKVPACWCETILPMVSSS